MNYLATILAVMKSIGAKLTDSELYELGKLLLRLFTLVALCYLAYMAYINHALIVSGQHTASAKTLLVGQGRNHIADTSKMVSTNATEAKP